MYLARTGKERKEATLRRQRRLRESYFSVPAPTAKCPRPLPTIVPPSAVTSSAWHFGCRSVYRICDCRNTAAEAVSLCGTLFRALHGATRQRTHVDVHGVVADPFVHPLLRRARLEEVRLRRHETAHAERAA